jgi:hypothetical protein
MTDPNVTQLITQLRAFAQGCRGSMWQSRDKTIRLMDEAAAALATTTDLQARLDAAEAKNAELVEAFHHHLTEVCAEFYTGEGTVAFLAAMEFLSTHNQGETA